MLVISLPEGLVKKVNEDLNIVFFKMIASQYGKEPKTDGLGSFPC